MFDHLLAEPEPVAGLSDAELIDAMTHYAAVEADVTARRLAAIAEFTARRPGGDEHAEWACDDWDAASIKVGAALKLSLGRASRQMELALTLRNRLPRVAAQLAAGEL